MHEDSGKGELAGYMKCHCGVMVPIKELIDNGYMCFDCRIALVLTEHDRPSPDRVSSTIIQDKGIFE